MGLLDRILSGTYRPDDQPPLVTPGIPTTVAGTAERIRSGEEILPAVRDLLDQTGRATAADTARMIADRPDPTGHAEADALLAGLAEHLATTRELAVPAWTQEPERFLERFWFVSAEPGFRAVALAQTPISLKRRGVLWPARSLERV